MKIFTSNHIKEADLATITNEPIQSVYLMERAAEAIAREICNIADEDSDYLFFVGRGNNGGDGLAIARILSNAGFRCRVYPVFGVENLTPDCKFNWDRLPEKVGRVSELKDIDPGENTIIVDSITGSGMRDKADKTLAEAILAINSMDNTVFSIDIPSGMKSEFGNDPARIVLADVTFSIEFPKVAMLLPEAGECCGDIRLVEIGLDKDFKLNTETDYFFTDINKVKKILKGRKKFMHKGDGGHAGLICGASGMVGASILSVSGALRSGCGLVTVHMPDRYSGAVFANTPSAMVSSDPRECFSKLPANPGRFTSMGIGCGIGNNEDTVHALERLLRAYRKPMVLDADALNIIAANPFMFRLIPENSILTPHPGELERLVGKWKNEEHKLRSVRALAKKINCVIIVKGAYSMVCLPGGDLHFNSTGNPGMAKGGSGDILTGLLTGLVARGYRPDEAALLGVYLHGLAGDKATEFYGAEAVNSSDIVEFIPEAFHIVYS